MADKAGWEVEGFIDRLTRRDDTNSERLVLEAISHLRAFSRDCDALRESNREAADEIERLRAALKQISGGHIPDASTLAITGNWHVFATELQRIARDAVALTNGQHGRGGE
jgi:DNA repair ATPase RecN